MKTRSENIEKLPTAGQVMKVLVNEQSKRKNVLSLWSKHVKIWFDDASYRTLLELSLSYGITAYPADKVIAAMLLAPSYDEVETERSKGAYPIKLQKIRLRGASQLLDMLGIPVPDALSCAPESSVQRRRATKRQVDEFIASIDEVLPLLTDLADKAKEANKVHQARSILNFRERLLNYREKITRSKKEQTDNVSPVPEQTIDIEDLF